MNVAHEKTFHTPGNISYPVIALAPKVWQQQLPFHLPFNFLLLSLHALSWSLCIAISVGVSNSRFASFATGATTAEPF